MTTKDFIARYVILKIAVGNYVVGQQIPSENQLAKQFRCTRLTVRQAYNQLVESNILVSKKGVGYFVKQPFFEKICLSYNCLKDKKLKFLSLTHLEDGNYFWTYQIYHQKELVGSIGFKYKKLLSTYKNLNNINEILVQLTLDCNLNWLKVIEEYSSKIEDYKIEGFNKEKYLHHITTTFVGSEDIYNLLIITNLKHDYFYFVRENIVI